MAAETLHLAATAQLWQGLLAHQSGEAVVINGSGLDIPAVVAIAHHGCLPRLTDDPVVLDRIEKSVSVLNDHLAKGKFVYGVNTGFGGSADTRTDRTTALQASLLQLTQAGILVTRDKVNDKSNSDSPLASHSMPAAWVRAALVVRCNTNARGHSALTLETLTSLLALLEHRITPVVPLRGSISASGDLMPLSYIAGAVEGNPDVYVQVADAEDNKTTITMSAREALAAAGLQPQIMKPKEGLALVNGTAFAAALASLALYESHQLAVLVQGLSAMGVEALGGTTESFHPFIAAVRPHDGQLECAQNMRSLLQGSRLALDGNQRAGLIQDRYAWRTVPQWIGPQLEDLLLAQAQVTTELNSSSDNPLVDPQSERIYSGGNFQAVAITSAMEKTRLALQMFGRLIFAQTGELIDPNFNNGLPTNLVADDPNTSFTMKGVDISMASYMAELAYLASPVSSHVQAAEMHNQAVNSMAFVSGRYTLQAAELVAMMCACNLYVCCQALDLRALHLSFLDAIAHRLKEVTGLLFSTVLSDKQVEKLNTALCGKIALVWPTTSRLVLDERITTTLNACLPVFLAGVTPQEDKGAEEEGSLLSTQDISAWMTGARELMHAVYKETWASFVAEPHTATLLGVGSKALYHVVRNEIGVPFHRGLVEHPTPSEGGDTLAGRDRKTVGSWISMIYEGIRGGKVGGALLEALCLCS
ncbi:hypothetical protein ASPZODRAFT_67410 [Penicilliopsis zonata CBS 506.65]|uniref:Phenylalanine ammonia-lyase n=1 Tax=Penicilliopsis zonata CBS 506.65 TaxID=1073090 RepID=A0A1L9SFT6_9EURO|nr:hypothetical protein ASPZODRAFT_67410 [Penicilliopsis zonata CBS 506.65]OJJ46021.1 hypothetical protein ASPZODRAFT_67410 [Penicilliopsis zonata CBS 506.65]